MSLTPTARPTWRIVADQLLVLGAMAAVGWLVLDRPARRAAPVAPPAAEEPAAVRLDPDPPAAQPPPAPSLDVAAIARAEQALDAARADRQRAEQRLAERQRRLEEAHQEEAAVSASLGGLEGRLQEAGSRLGALQEQGAALQREQDRLREELTSLAHAPRPRRKPLVDKTPVARPAQGEEYHFEIRRDRIAYIDLDRLVERVKADAQIQLRLAANNPAALIKPITSSVGPVGAFALRYELGRSIPGSLSELMGSRGVTFSLLGWEVVPVRERRGETFAMIQQPASDLYRVLNSLNPSHATITLWVYPDGFALYRELNDYLHDRGFLVAARPLPAGMPIRGSPAGSLSAGQ
jgi:hypothetical protein